MGVRLAPAHGGEQDFHDICDRLYEARVSTGIKITIDRIDKISAVAEYLALDPSPIQDALGIPTAKRTWEIPRRTLDQGEVEALYEFCDELAAVLDEVIDIQMIKQTIRDTPEDERWVDQFNQSTVDYYNVSRYARAFRALCEKSLEWNFGLKIT